VSTASPHEDDDSLDADSFQEQFLLETPTGHIATLEEIAEGDENESRESHSTSKLLEDEKREIGARLGKVRALGIFSPEEEKGSADSKRSENKKADRHVDVERLTGGAGGEGAEDEAAAEKDKETSNAGTSPLVEPPSVPLATSRVTPHGPTLELVIGHKKVRTRDASASAENRVTLYGDQDVEISIRSEAHISVTRKDSKSPKKGGDADETRKGSVKMTQTPVEEVPADTGPGNVGHSTERVEVTFHSSAKGGDEGSPEHCSGVYILPVRGGRDKKREETVLFSGEESVYRYDAGEAIGSTYDSPGTDESASHHITDTGISLTRGTTTTDTLTSYAQRPPLSLEIGVDRGLTTDTAVDVESEESELTDAGLSPIQADDTATTDLKFFDEEITLVNYCDTSTSPLEFQAVESSSVALSPFEVPTSEASVYTDSVDVRDTGVSPIGSDDDSPKIPSSAPLSDESRRSSGEVKNLIRMIEENVQQQNQQDAGALKKIKKSVADPKTPRSSLSEDYVEPDTKSYKSEAVFQVGSTQPKTDISSPAHTPKHIGPKVKELQKLLTQSMEGSDHEDEVPKYHKTIHQLADDDSDDEHSLPGVSKVVEDFEKRLATPKHAQYVRTEDIKKIILKDALPGTEPTKSLPEEDSILEVQIISAAVDQQPIKDDGMSREMKSSVFEVRDHPPSAITTDFKTTQRTDTEETKITKKSGSIDRETVATEHYEQVSEVTVEEVSTATRRDDYKNKKVTDDNCSEHIKRTTITKEKTETEQRVLRETLIRQADEQHGSDTRESVERLKSTLTTAVIETTEECVGGAAKVGAEDTGPERGDTVPESSSRSEIKRVTGKGQIFETISESAQSTVKDKVSTDVLGQSKERRVETYSFSKVETQTEVHTVSQVKGGNDKTIQDEEPEVKVEVADETKSDLFTEKEEGLSDDLSVTVEDESDEVPAESTIKESLATAEETLKRISETLDTEPLETSEEQPDEKDSSVAMESIKQSLVTTEETLVRLREALQAPEVRDEAIRKSEEVSPVSEDSKSSESVKTQCDVITKTAITEKERPESKTDVLEEEGDKDRPKTLRNEKIITEKDVSALMSEVAECTRQIKQEVRQLKPDLTPTPDGTDMSTLNLAYAREFGMSHIPEAGSVGDQPSVSDDDAQVDSKDAPQPSSTTSSVDEKSALGAKTVEQDSDALTHDASAPLKPVEQEDKPVARDVNAFVKEDGVAEVQFQGEEPESQVKKEINFVQNELKSALTVAIAVGQSKAMDASTIPILSLDTDKREAGHETESLQQTSLEAVTSSQPSEGFKEDIGKEEETVGKSPSEAECAYVEKAPCLKGPDEMTDEVPDKCFVKTIVPESVILDFKSVESVEISEKIQETPEEIGDGRSLHSRVETLSDKEKEYVISEKRIATSDVKSYITASSSDTETEEANAPETMREDVGEPQDELATAPRLEPSQTPQVKELTPEHPKPYSKSDPHLSSEAAEATICKVALDVQSSVGEVVKRMETVIETIHMHESKALTAQGSKLGEASMDVKVEKPTDSDVYRSNEVHFDGRKDTSTPDDSKGSTEVISESDGKPLSPDQIEAADKLGKGFTILKDEIKGDVESSPAGDTEPAPADALIRHTEKTATTFVSETKIDSFETEPGEEKKEMKGTQTVAQGPSEQLSDEIGKILAYSVEPDEKPDQEATEVTKGVIVKLDEASFDKKEQGAIIEVKTIEASVSSLISTLEKLQPFQAAEDKSKASEERDESLLPGDITPPVQGDEEKPSKNIDKLIFEKQVESDEMKVPSGKEGQADENADPEENKPTIGETVPESTHKKETLTDPLFFSENGNDKKQSVVIQEKEPISGELVSDGEVSATAIERKESEEQVIDKTSPEMVKGAAPIKKGDSPEDDEAPVPAPTQERPLEEEKGISPSGERVTAKVEERKESPKEELELLEEDEPMKELKKEKKTKAHDESLKDERPVKVETGTILEKKEVVEEIQKTIGEKTPKDQAVTVQEESQAQSLVSKETALSKPGENYKVEGAEEEEYEKQVQSEDEEPSELEKDIDGEKEVINYEQVTSHIEGSKVIATSVEKKTVKEIVGIEKPASLVGDRQSGPDDQEKGFQDRIASTIPAHEKLDTVPAVEILEPPKHERIAPSEQKQQDKPVEEEPATSGREPAAIDGAKTSPQDEIIPSEEPAKREDEKASEKTTLSKGSKASDEGEDEVVAQTRTAVKETIELKIVTLSAEDKEPVMPVMGKESSKYEKLAKSSTLTEGEAPEPVQERKLPEESLQISKDISMTVSTVEEFTEGKAIETTSDETENTKTEVDEDREEPQDRDKLDLSHGEDLVSDDKILDVTARAAVLSSSSALPEASDDKELREPLEKDESRRLHEAKSVIKEDIVEANREAVGVTTISNVRDVAEKESDIPDKIVPRVAEKDSKPLPSDKPVPSDKFNISKVSDNVEFKFVPAVADKAKVGSVTEGFRGDIFEVAEVKDPTLADESVSVGQPAAEENDEKPDLQDPTLCSESAKIESFKEEKTGDGEKDLDESVDSPTCLEVTHNIIEKVYGISRDTTGVLQNQASITETVLSEIGPAKESVTDEVLGMLAETIKEEPLSRIFDHTRTLPGMVQPDTQSESQKIDVTVEVPATSSEFGVRSEVSVSLDIVQTGSLEADLFKTEAIDEDDARAVTQDIIKKVYGPHTTAGVYQSIDVSLMTDVEHASPVTQDLIQETLTRVDKTEGPGLDIPSPDGEAVTAEIIKKYYGIERKEDRSLWETGEGPIPSTVSKSREQLAHHMIATTVVETSTGQGEDSSPKTKNEEYIVSESPATDRSEPVPSMQGSAAQEPRHEEFHYSASEKNESIEPVSKKEESLKHDVVEKEVASVTAEQVSTKAEDREASEVEARKSPKPETTEQKLPKAGAQESAYLETTDKALLSTEAKEPPRPETGDGAPPKTKPKETHKTASPGVVADDYSMTDTEEKASPEAEAKGSLKLGVGGSVPAIGSSRKPEADNRLPVSEPVLPSTPLLESTELLPEEKITVTHETTKEEETKISSVREENLPPDVEQPHLRKDNEAEHGTKDVDDNYKLKEDIEDRPDADNKRILKESVELEETQAPTLERQGALKTSRGIIKNIAAVTVGGIFVATEHVSDLLHSSADKETEHLKIQTKELMLEKGIIEETQAASVIATEKNVQLSVSSEDVNTRYSETNEGEVRKSGKKKESPFEVKEMPTRSRLSSGEEHVLTEDQEEVPAPEQTTERQATAALSKEQETSKAPTDEEEYPKTPEAKPPQVAEKISLTEKDELLSKHSPVGAEASTATTAKDEGAPKIEPVTLGEEVSMTTAEKEPPMHLKKAKSQDESPSVISPNESNAETDHEGVKERTTSSSKKLGGMEGHRAQAEELEQSLGEGTTDVLVTENVLSTTTVIKEENTEFSGDLKETSSPLAQEKDTLAAMTEPKEEIGISCLGDEGPLKPSDLVTLSPMYEAEATGVVSRTPVADERTSSEAKGHELLKTVENQASIILRPEDVAPGTSVEEGKIPDCEARVGILSEPSSEIKQVPERGGKEPGLPDIAPDQDVLKTFGEDKMTAEPASQGEATAKGDDIAAETRVEEKGTLSEYAKDSKKSGTAGLDVTAPLSVGDENTPELVVEEKDQAGHGKNMEASTPKSETLELAAEVTEPISSCEYLKLEHHESDETVTIGIIRKVYGIERGPTKDISITAQSGSKIETDTTFKAISEEKVVYEPAVESEKVREPEASAIKATTLDSDNQGALKLKAESQEASTPESPEPRIVKPKVEEAKDAKHPVEVEVLTLEIEKAKAPRPEDRQAPPVAVVSEEATKPPVEEAKVSEPGDVQALSPAVGSEEVPKLEAEGAKTLEREVKRTPEVEVDLKEIPQSEVNKANPPTPVNEQAHMTAVETSEIVKPEVQEAKEPKLEERQASKEAVEFEVTPKRKVEDAISFESEREHAPRAEIESYEPKPKMEEAKARKSQDKQAPYEIAVELGDLPMSDVEQIEISHSSNKESFKPAVELNKALELEDTETETPEENKNAPQQIAEFKGTPKPMVEESRAPEPDGILSPHPARELKEAFRPGVEEAKFHGLENEKASKPAVELFETLKSQIDEAEISEQEAQQCLTSPPQVKEARTPEVEEAKAPEHVDEQAIQPTSKSKETYLEPTDESSTSEDTAKDIAKTETIELLTQDETKVSEKFEPQIEGGGQEVAKQQVDEEEADDVDGSKEATLEREFLRSDIEVASSEASASKPLVMSVETGGNESSKQGSVPSARKTSTIHFEDTEISHSQETVMTEHKETIFQVHTTRGTATSTPENERKSEDISSDVAREVTHSSMNLEVVTDDLPVVSNVDAADHKPVSPAGNEIGTTEDETSCDAKPIADSPVAVVDLIVKPVSETAAVSTQSSLQHGETLLQHKPSEGERSSPDVTKKEEKMPVSAIDSLESSEEDIRQEPKSRQHDIPELAPDSKDVEVKITEKSSGIVSNVVDKLEVILKDHKAPDVVTEMTSNADIKEVIELAETISRSEAVIVKPVQVSAITSTITSEEHVSLPKEAITKTVSETTTEIMSERVKDECKIESPQVLGEPVSHSEFEVTTTEEDNKPVSVKLPESFEIDVLDTRASISDLKDAVSALSTGARSGASTALEDKVSESPEHATDDVSESHAHHDIFMPEVEISKPRVDDELVEKRTTDSKDKQPSPTEKIGEGPSTMGIEFKASASQGEVPDSTVTLSENVHVFVDNRISKSTTILEDLSSGEVKSDVSDLKQLTLEKTTTSIDKDITIQVDLSVDTEVVSMDKTSSEPSPRSGSPFGDKTIPTILLTPDTDESEGAEGILPETDGVPQTETEVGPREHEVKKTPLSKGQDVPGNDSTEDSFGKDDILTSETVEASRQSTLEEDGDVAAKVRRVTQEITHASGVIHDTTSVVRKEETASVENVTKHVSAYVAGKAESVVKSAVTSQITEHATIADIDKFVTIDSKSTAEATIPSEEEIDVIQTQEELEPATPSGKALFFKRVKIESSKSEELPKESVSSEEAIAKSPSDPVKEDIVPVATAGKTQGLSDEKVLSDVETQEEEERVSSQDDLIVIDDLKTAVQDSPNTATSTSSQAPTSDGESKHSLLEESKRQEKPFEELVVKKTTKDETVEMLRRERVMNADAESKLTHSGKSPEEGRKSVIKGVAGLAMETLFGAIGGVAQKAAEQMESLYTDEPILISPESTLTATVDKTSFPESRSVESVKPDSPDDSPKVVKIRKSKETQIRLVTKEATTFVTDPLVEEKGQTDIKPTSGLEEKPEETAAPESVLRSGDIEEKVLHSLDDLEKSSVVPELIKNIPSDEDDYSASFIKDNDTTTASEMPSELEYARSTETSMIESFVDFKQSSKSESQSEDCSKVSEPLCVKVTLPTGPINDATKKVETSPTMKQFEHIIGLEPPKKEPSSKIKAGVCEGVGGIEEVCIRKTVTRSLDSEASSVGKSEDSIPNEAHTSIDISFSSAALTESATSSEVDQDSMKLSKDFDSPADVEKSGQEGSIDKVVNIGDEDSCTDFSMPETSEEELKMVEERLVSMIEETQSAPASLVTVDSKVTETCSPKGALIEAKEPVCVKVVVKRPIDNIVIEPAEVTEVKLEEFETVEEEGLVPAIPPRSISMEEIIEEPCVKKSCGLSYSSDGEETKVDSLSKETTTVGTESENQPVEPSAELVTTKVFTTTTITGADGEVEVIKKAYETEALVEEPRQASASSVTSSADEVRSEITSDDIQMSDDILQVTIPEGDPALRASKPAESGRDSNFRRKGTFRSSTNSDVHKRTVKSSLETKTVTSEGTTRTRSQVVKSEQQSPKQPLKSKEKASGFSDTEKRVYSVTSSKIHVTDAALKKSYVSPYSQSVIRSTAQTQVTQTQHVVRSEKPIPHRQLPMHHYMMSTVSRDRKLEGKMGSREGTPTRASPVSASPIHTRHSPLARSASEKAYLKSADVEKIRKVTDIKRADSFRSTLPSYGRSYSQPEKSQTILQRTSTSSSSKMVTRSTPKDTMTVTRTKTRPLSMYSKRTSSTGIVNPEDILSSRSLDTPGPSSAPSSLITLRKRDSSRSKAKSKSSESDASSSSKSAKRSAKVGHVISTPSESSESASPPVLSPRTIIISDTVSPEPSEVSQLESAIEIERPIEPPARRASSAPIPSSREAEYSAGSPIRRRIQTSLPSSPSRFARGQSGMVTQLLTSEVFTRTVESTDAIEVVYRQPGSLEPPKRPETDASFFDTTTDSSLSESTAIPSSTTSSEQETSSGRRRSQSVSPKPTKRALDMIPDMTGAEMLSPDTTFQSTTITETDQSLDESLELERPTSETVRVPLESHEIDGQVSQELLSPYLEMLAISPTRVRHSFRYESEAAGVSVNLPSGNPQSQSALCRGMAYAPVTRQFNAAVQVPDSVPRPSVDT